MEDNTFGAAIHHRLLARDALAPEDLCERWLEPLVDELSRAFPAVARRDDSLIRTAVIDALLNYVENPASYRPDRTSLRRFLFFSARGDLLNAIERDQRRSAREVAVVDVEDLARSRNDSQDDSPSAPDAAVVTIDPEQYGQLLARHFPNDRDRRILGLILDGERKTARFAAVLGIEHLDRSAQQREVKRHKDRIGKRLRRLGVQLREQP